MRSLIDQLAAAGPRLDRPATPARSRADRRARSGRARRAAPRRTAGRSASSRSERTRMEPVVVTDPHDAASRAGRVARAASSGGTVDGPGLLDEHVLARARPRPARRRRARRASWPRSPVRRRRACRSSSRCGSTGVTERSHRPSAGGRRSCVAGRGTATTSPSAADDRARLAPMRPQPTIATPSVMPRPAFAIEVLVDATQAVARRPPRWRAALARATSGSSHRALKQAARQPAGVVARRGTRRGRATSRDRPGRSSVAVA